MIDTKMDAICIIVISYVQLEQQRRIRALRQLPHDCFMPCGALLATVPGATPPRLTCRVVKNVVIADMASGHGRRRRCTSKGDDGV